MYFEQFYLTCLAQASYIVGSDGVAAVVDPQRDVDQYIDDAKQHGLEIKYVIETHLHADFVSGHRELAARTGAKIVMGAAAGAKFEHLGVHDGDQIALGKVQLHFLETPGHTPESICVLITDTGTSTRPTKVLTGDTLFIGDVGRPDLSPNHTPRELAGLLYDSLRDKLMPLSDDVEVYPAHGAGSLCGKNLSPERWSTMGQQRQFNYALRDMSREAFIDMLTAELPDRPEYFSQDAAINRDGPGLLSEVPPPPALDPRTVALNLKTGAVVIDTRPASQFGAGHLPGAVNIGLGGQYATWAATVVGLKRPVVLIVEDEEHVHEATLRLARVGMESVVGWLQGGVAAWEAAGLPLVTVPQVSVHQLKEHEGEWQILDVRRDGEWKAGHIEGAIHQSLDTLGKSFGAPGTSAWTELDPSKPVAVHCKSGYRSSAATGVLQAHGFREVYNVTGGFDAWAASGLPVEVPTPAQAAPVSA